MCTSIASQLTDLKNLVQWHKDDLFIQKYLWTFVNCGFYRDWNSFLNLSLHLFLFVIVGAWFIVQLRWLLLMAIKKSASCEKRFSSNKTTSWRRSNIIACLSFVFSQQHRFYTESGNTRACIPRRQQYNSPCSIHACHFSVLLCYRRRESWQTAISILFVFNFLRFILYYQLR